MGIEGNSVATGTLFATWSAGGVTTVPVFRAELVGWRTTVPVSRAGSNPADGGPPRPGEPGGQMVKVAMEPSAFPQSLEATARTS